MITPRQTILISVDGPRAAHRAIAGACTTDVSLTRSTVVLVPTRSAASRLRRTLEDLHLAASADAGADSALVLPDILTRADFYRRLQRHAADRRALSPIEREVLLAAAARHAVAGGQVPPFRMRPGLVAEMLALYDGLLRRGKSVDAFERLVVDDLQPRAEFDRGAARLLGQTVFLVAAFREFERRIDETRALDEHRLRQLLLSGEAAPTLRRVFVAMGDEVAEGPAGLWPADFDLLSRLPGLDEILVVATRTTLLAGFGERLQQLLPGVEIDARTEADPPPVLAAPAADRLHFTSRDREEELRGIARRIKRDLRAAAPRRPLAAVVFRRPLPYVYLGRTLLDSAGVEYQAADALPLAAEPFAAALDVICSAVTGGFVRAALIELLGSPHFEFADGGRRLSARDLDGLDRALAEAGYLGGRARLAALARQGPGPAARAAQIAAEVADELAPLEVDAPVSAHVAVLIAFLREHERLVAGDDGVQERHLRARAAVLRVLADLRDAARAHDDPVVTFAEVAAAVRRWIEEQTFTPTRGEAGIQLLDAQAARYGEFDDVHLAGLVAGDWPEGATRNIFYPQFLLAQLGWPSEAARLAAERARFVDLLRLARRSVSVSSFTLEDDSIVEASPLLEEVERAGLEVRRSTEPTGRIFADEAVAAGPGVGLPGEQAAAWLALRASRSPATDRRFHGSAPGDHASGGTGHPPCDSSPPTGSYTVTGIDRYLECPFKYFARTVLQLPEEAADEEGMSPRERGQFVHELLRDFFERWQARGESAVTVDNLDGARALFAEVVESRLASLPPVEASLERIRLLGSVAAPGLGETVLAAEAVRPTPVIRRLLEFPFEGCFTFAAGGVTRAVRLRGKADRVDLLSDGRLRVIDYKTGRAPTGAIQLPIYAVCLQQHLEATEGRRWEIGEAFYLAFGERHDAVSRAVEDGPGAAKAVDEAQGQLLEAVAGIERGDFPARPRAQWLCGSCPYADVCRKDYALAE